MHNRSPWGDTIIRWPDTRAFLKAISPLPIPDQIRVMSMMLREHPRMVQDPLVEEFCTRHAAYVTYSMVYRGSDADGLRD